MKNQSIKRKSVSKKYLAWTSLFLTLLLLQGCATWFYTNNHKESACEDESYPPYSDDTDRSCGNDDALLMVAILIDVAIAKILYSEIKSAIRKKSVDTVQVNDLICEEPTPNKVCTSSAGCLCEQ